MTQFTVSEPEKIAVADLAIGILPSGASGQGEAPVHARILGITGVVSFEKGVALFTKISTGFYIIDLDAPIPTDEMSIHVHPESGSARMVGYGPVTTTQIEVRSFDSAAAVADMNFRMTIWQVPLT